MANCKYDCVTLHNGVRIPQLGLGVWRAEDGAETANAVRWAIEAGYRHIDTAYFYMNEKGVGQGIRDSGVPREEVWVTTKLWNSDHGYDKALAAFERSRGLLGLEYIDLFLIHWPGKRKFVETWKALEKLYEDKKVRAIGVCNFEPHHLTELFQDCKIRPMVNQVELHPQLQQHAVRDFCRRHNIAVIAWSPLGKGARSGILQNPLLGEIAKRYSKSPAQVIIRWDLQHGIVAIPKSTHQGRIKENFNVWDFRLSEEEMRQIDSLNEDKRLGGHPDEFFPDGEE
ncbi:prostaglandin F synthase [Trypanosoma conorhini]|uniref:9,11-endoperoxide prostaglandin H2 reductase n=1 Tax=Trypanosoma conorhini TaxID=83891 RepID=A0A422P1F5_9TRYP|nr:prostaglandin F synthase [Trypanosoma conorhini]RNF11573.1 prostaglandin F synthase [Trypanosoma conorhini]